MKIIQDLNNLHGDPELCHIITNVYFSYSFKSLFQHNLPLLQCSEADCIADFVLRKDIRLKSPGACSLEFQSVMQIVVECMLH
jgi:hypothetical protein